MTITLYSISDSPPSCAVRLCLEYLKIDFTLVNINYVKGEHLEETFAQKNPQREVPVLDDNGFLLSESSAILQYLGDKYDSNGRIYPRDFQSRAVINHRLAFNISTYYQRILDYAIMPIFFDYEQTSVGKNKMTVALSVFERILQKQNAKFACGDNLTIADFALVSATLCLEGVEYDLSIYSNITLWYSNFKKMYPSLWAVAEKVMLELREFKKNSPDLSAMVHPYHPKYEEELPEVAELPESERNANTIYSFKKNTKEYLLHHCFYSVRNYLEEGK